MMYSYIVILLVFLSTDKLMFLVYDLDRNVLISGLNFVPKDGFVCKYK